MPSKVTLFLCDLAHALSLCPAPVHMLLLGWWLLLLLTAARMAMKCVVNRAGYAGRHAGRPAANISSHHPATSVRRLHTNFRSPSPVAVVGSERATTSE
jgi:hypothetical protein